MKNLAHSQLLTGKGPPPTQRGPGHDLEQASALASVTA
jgi:hypothetical protein